MELKLPDNSNDAARRKQDDFFAQMFKGKPDNAPEEDDISDHYDVHAELSKWTGVSYERVEEIDKMVLDIHQDENSILAVSKRIKALKWEIEDPDERMVLAFCWGRVIQNYSDMAKRREGALSALGKLKGVMSISVGDGDDPDSIATKIQDVIREGIRRFGKKEEED